MHKPQLMVNGFFYKIGVNAQKHVEQEKVSNKECANHQRMEVNNALDHLLEKNLATLNHVKDSVSIKPNN